MHTPTHTCASSKKPIPSPCNPESPISKLRVAFQPEHKSIEAPPLPEQRGPIDNNPVREELSGHGENPKIETRACQKHPRRKAALQRDWGQAANTSPTHHHRQLEVPAIWHVFWKAWVRSRRLGARWGPLPQPKVATDVDIPVRIRGRGEGGKENESEVGLKRREGGVIVSSRLGAAGRVFACVCVC